MELFHSWSNAILNRSMSASLMWLIAFWTCLWTCSCVLLWTCSNLFCALWTCPWHLISAEFMLPERLSDFHFQPIFPSWTCPIHLLMNPSLMCSMPLWTCSIHDLMPSWTSLWPPFSAEFMLPIRVHERLSMTSPFSDDFPLLNRSVNPSLMWLSALWTSQELFHSWFNALWTLLWCDLKPSE